MAKKSFEEMLRDLSDRPEKSPLYHAINHVAGSYLMAKAWFEDHDVNHAPADLEAFTSLVLDRWRELDR